MLGKHPRILYYYILTQHIYYYFFLFNFCSTLVQWK